MGRNMVIFLKDKGRKISLIKAYDCYSFLKNVFFYRLYTSVYSFVYTERGLRKTVPSSFSNLRYLRKQLKSNTYFE